MKETDSTREYEQGRVHNPKHHIQARTATPNPSRFQKGELGFYSLWTGPAAPSLGSPNVL